MTIWQRNISSRKLVDTNFHGNCQRLKILDFIQSMLFFRDRKMKQFFLRFQTHRWTGLDIPYELCLCYISHSPVNRRAWWEQNLQKIKRFHFIKYNIDLYCKQKRICFYGTYMVLSKRFMLIKYYCNFQNKFMVTVLVPHVARS